MRIIKDLKNEKTYLAGQSFIIPNELRNRIYTEDVDVEVVSVSDDRIGISNGVLTYLHSEDIWIWEEFAMNKQINRKEDYKEHVVAVYVLIADNGER